MDERGEAVVLGAIAAADSPAQSLRSHGLVERGHDLRARRVRLASLSMLEEARMLERRSLRRSRNLPLANVPLQLCETDATEWARGSPEAAIDNLLRESDRVEELGAAVARNVRDPHLRHHLHDAVLDRRAEPALRLVGRRVIAADLVCGSHGGNGLEREPRANRLGAIPEQAGEVMHLARLVARDHDRGERAEADFDETVVDGPRGEKRRHRRTLGARASVRDEQNVGAGPDGRLGLGGQTLAGRLERLPRAEGGVDRRRPETVETARVEKEALQLDQLLRRCFLGEERRPRTEQGAKRHDMALAQVVDRWVRDLREALLEVSVEGPRPAGQRRQRRVVAHRRRRLVRVRRDRPQDLHELLARVPEGHLAG